MQTSGFTIAFVLIALTVACSGHAPVGADSTTDVLAEAKTHALAPESTVHHEIRCNGHTWALLEDGQPPRVERDRGTDSLALQAPRGMDAYVPVGIGCAQSSGGVQYLVVEYGEKPVGCKVCEWFFVYDADGKPLNESTPPIRGYAESLEANNDGYGRMLRELDLTHPRIEYPPPASR